MIHNNLNTTHISFTKSKQTCHDSQSSTTLKTLLYKDKTKQNKL